MKQIPAWITIVTAVGLLCLLLFLEADPIVPPLLAICLALLTRQVLFSLFIGVLLGSVIHHGSVISGLLRVFDTYLVDALTDRSHCAIIIFSMALAGMVGVISRSGGTRGIVEALVKYATGPRSGQVATWVMGIFIFFDDYANTLVVGNTMRPLTDRLRVSREKLAYIVDSTAAPVASLALISTWIGYEISLIQDSFVKEGISKWTGYAAFLSSMPYRFYSILTLSMVFLVAYLLRDFGAMYEAEKRCRTTGQTLAEGAHPLSNFTSDEVKPLPGTPMRWYNALIPIGVLIAVTMGGLYHTGWSSLYCDTRKLCIIEMRKAMMKAADARPQSLSHQARRKIEKALDARRPEINARALQVMKGKTLRQIISRADSSKVLLWSAFICSLIAIALPLLQGIGGGMQALIDAWVSGAKSMVLATMILLLAWSLGAVCEHLHTAKFIVSYAQNIFSPWVLPGMTFILAAAMAFATGTSWGTMSIILPLAIPLAHRLSLNAGLSPAVYENVLFGTIGAVLSGSCFGDHSSPISDTTIMSSMASGCDHIDHVRTQLPYALLAAGSAVFLCYIPSGFGFSPFVTIPLGMGGILAFLLIYGRSTDLKETA